MPLPNYYPKGWHYHISRDVIDHTYLLDMRIPKVRAMFRYVFGVYTQKYNVKLHALAVVLNHVHFICTDTDGVLHKFLRDLFRVLAAAMNFILNRTGTFWEPAKEPFRKHIAPTDFNTLANITAYVKINGYKHGYTADWIDWPGLLTPMSMIDQEVEIPRPDGKDDYFSNRTDSSMPKVTSFSFSTPAGIAPKTWKKMLGKCIARLLAIHKQKVKPRPPWGKGVSETLAERKAKRQQHRGSALLRLFAGDKEVREWQIANYLGFVAQHRLAWACWEKGKKQKVLFPYGTGEMRRVALVAEEPGDASALPDFVDDYIEGELDSLEAQLEFGIVLPSARKKAKRKNRRRGKRRRR